MQLKSMCIRHDRRVWMNCVRWGLPKRYLRGSCYDTVCLSICNVRSSPTYIFEGNSCRMVFLKSGE